jgi:hypothetical protein
VSDGIATDTTAAVRLRQNVNHAPVAFADPVAPVFDNVGLVTAERSGADAAATPFRCAGSRSPDCL